MAAPPSLAVEQHDEDTTLEGVLALLDEYEASPASYACVFASSSSDDDALSLLPAAIESTAAAEHLSVVSAPPLRELLALMPPPLQLLSPSAPLVLGTRPLTLTSKPRAGSKKALARGNTNKARDDRKEELIYLRRKVVELETQLTAIKKSLPIPKRSDGPAVAKDEPLARKSQQRYSSVAPVWKELAVRQCDKRMKSERENIRLKLVLENQIKVAKSLEKFLLKTAMSSELEKCIHGEKKLLHVYALRRDEDPGSIFAELLADMDQSYAEVDAIFEANGLANIDTSSSIDVQMRSDHEGSAVRLELFVNKLMPFDLHATGSAVWNHYVYAKDRLPNRMYNHSIRHNVDASEDTIIDNFTLHINLNRQSSQFYAQQVLRRYVEESRIVIVWRALFDQTRMGDEPLSGVKFLEKGYIVLRRPRRTSGNSATPLNIHENYTLLQTSCVETPVLTDVRLDPLKAGAITDFAMTATAMNITGSHQMIEDVLLEQSLGF
uniref:M96 mating-specific protein family n=1 Tax=Globisporangium ultimum (strain ATCC 200006 / CBS 805.95 / DAOM BR144) TaxID=431595 RepID=K3W8X4_GLOUD